MELFQRILVKYDLEYERLLNGLEIGERRKKDVENENTRKICKEILLSTEYTPIEFIKNISSTIGKRLDLEICVESSDSEESDGEEVTDEEPLFTEQDINFCFLYTHKFVEIVI